MPAGKAASWSKKKFISFAFSLGALIAVAGFLRGVQNANTATDKAKVDIELLSKAIEQHKLDFGDYPGFDEDTPIDGEASEELYKALFYDGWNYETKKLGEEAKIYLKELDPRNGKSRMVKSTSHKVPARDLKILDPWGRPYRYRKGTFANNPDFDLWSTGKDGLTNPLDRNSKENRDDIRNF